MSPILVLGATGRVGSAAIKYLLEKDSKIHALVRTPSKLPSSPNLTFTIQEGQFPQRKQLESIISEMKPTTIVTAMGALQYLFFGKLFVTDGMKDLVEIINDLKPAFPVKLIVLSTAGVSVEGDKRPFSDKFITAACGLVANYRDNLALCAYAKTVSSPYVEWVLVRPTNFVEGDAGPDFTVTEFIECSVFDSLAKSHISNIGKFMANLAGDQSEWAKWKGKMPFLRNVPTPEVN